MDARRRRTSDDAYLRRQEHEIRRAVTQHHLARNAIGARDVGTVRALRLAI